MATRALFVGVNDYRHPKIRNLAGARRDAEALWALFVDTVPGVEAELLVDAKATFQAVHDGIRDLLANATDSDTIVVHFSGHGTKDHRLVLHDTDRDSVAGRLATTLDMRTVARWFRETKARALLMMLDCCHSGGAPAKVLVDDEEVATKDDFDPEVEFVGTGRVLLAASAPHEVAFEAGAQRQGLLTAAVIHVLTSSERQLDAGEFCAEVTSQVRARAVAIGREQSPHHVGAIGGGLLLPRLRRGAEWERLFPDLSTLNVHTWSDLAHFGLPPELLAQCSARYSSGLNALQLRAVNTHRILDGRSALIIAPTGAGKTFAGELAALRAVAQGQRAVFALPYKALTTEKYDEFVRTYSTLGYRVIRCTGDYADQAALFAAGKYDIALLTYEMLLGLGVGIDGALDPVGAVIVDEAQFIADPHRGIVVELLLAVLRRRADLGLQLVLLSAVIGDTSGLETWLECSVLQWTERPVPLVEGVLDRNGIYEYRDTDGSRKSEQLLPRFTIRQRGKEASAQDVIVPLAAQLLKDPNETLLVFRNTRGSAEGSAGYLADELGLPPTSDEFLARLPVDGQSRSSPALRRCMERGTAFHSTNLQRDEREAVEAAFRQGSLRVLVATSGLAAGINTPASTVLIVEHEFMNKPPQPFTVAEYKNMAGRAGRPGFHAAGRSILYAENAFERSRLFAHYVCGTPEAVRSSFTDGDTSTWLLRLLGQVGALRPDDVAGLLLSTFGGFLAAMQSPAWTAGATTRVNALIERMQKLELLESVGDKLRLSLLGRACANTILGFDSCLRVVELIRTLPTTALSAETLCVALQVLEELDARYTPLSGKTARDKARPAELQDRVGYSTVHQLQRGAEDTDAYLKRCKRALVVLDWVNGASIETIEENYSANMYSRLGFGDIQGIADATRYNLRAVFDIGCLVQPALASCPVDDMLVRLEYGVPDECLPLIKGVAHRWTRTELLALLAAGVSSAEALWSRSDDELAEIIGGTAARLVALRPRKDPPS
jgi:helicase